MPEAAMYENSRAVLGQHDVGTAREITPVQAKAKSRALKEAPDCELRRRVLSADAGHHPASCCAIDDVCHVSPRLRTPARAALDAGDSRR